MQDSNDAAGEIMPSYFLYKERQAKREAASVNGVLNVPDYSSVSTTPEITEKIRKESNKHPR
jgi:hypothetical protein